MKEVVEVLNKYIEKNYHLEGKFIPSKSFVIDKNFFEKPYVCLDEEIYDKYITVGNNKNRSVSIIVYIKNNIESINEINRVFF